MSRDILIYGAGGAGRDLAFYLSLDKNPDTAWNIHGFIDDTEELQKQVLNGVPILGGFEYLLNFSGNIAVAIVDDPAVRRNLVLKLKKNSKVKFPVVISPNSIISSFIEWGEGCIISGAHNAISVDVKIGDYVFVAGRCGIGHDANIGEYTTIFAGITIGGGVSIGAECVIGSGATILPKIKIGDGSKIGAGAVVSKNIPPGVIAAGVPAKIMRKIK